VSALSCKNSGASKTPSDGPNAALIQPSDYVAEHLFSGGALGSLLMRDTVPSNGGSWLDDVAVGSVLVSGGVGAAPAWSSAPTLAIGATGNAQFLQATLSDHGAVGHFNFCVGYAANAGDAARGDHVLTVGYNTTPGGGRSNTNEPAFEWRVEDYYKPAGTAYVEAHFQYYDPAGNGFRPWAMQIDRSVNGYLTNATVGVTASGFSYFAINGVQYFQFKQQQLQVINGSLVTMEQNNYYWGKQLNAAGSAYVELPYINASDQLVLGGQSVTGVKALSNAIASAASGKRYLVIDTAGVITSQASAPVGT